MTKDLAASVRARLVACVPQEEPTRRYATGRSGHDAANNAGARAHSGRDTRVICRHGRDRRACGRGGGRGVLLLLPGLRLVRPVRLGGRFLCRRRGLHPGRSDGADRFGGFRDRGDRLRRSLGMGQGTPEPNPRTGTFLKLPQNWDTLCIRQRIVRLPRSSSSQALGDE